MNFSLLVHSCILNVWNQAFTWLTFNKYFLELMNKERKKCRKVYIYSFLWQSSIKINVDGLSEDLK